LQALLHVLLVAAVVKILLTVAQTAQGCGTTGGGGGGAGGVVFLALEKAAAAMQNYSGSVLIDGGPGGRILPRSTSKNDIKHCKGKSDVSRDGQGGYAGKIYSQMCPRGYAGSLCRACEAGKYMKHETAGASESGCPLSAPESCSPSVYREVANSSCADCELPSIGWKFRNEIKNRLYQNRLSWQGRGATSNKDCKYHCHPELTFPDCLNPIERLYVVLGSSVILMALAILSPILLSVLARGVLKLLFENEHETEPDNPPAGGLSSSFSAGDAGGNEYSSLMPEHDGRDTKSQTFARQIRQLFGVTSPRRVQEPGGLQRHGRLSASASEIGSYELAIQEKELPYLISRVYLVGDNSISKPWIMLTEPPDSLKEVGVNDETYSSIADHATMLVKWQFGEAVVYWVLGLFCMPWAQRWHRSCRRRHFKALQAYVKNSFDWSAFSNEAMQSHQDAVKLGCSMDGTVCYLDILDLHSTSSRKGGTKAADAPARAGPRLPDMLRLAGSGSFDVPINLDTEDVLAQSICALAGPGFAARMNAVLQPLGTALNLLQPDTDLVPLLEFISNENNSKHSSVQLELRTIYENRNKESRVFLLVRHKSGLLGGSTGSLARDFSAELRGTRFKNTSDQKILVEDDLWDTSFIQHFTRKLKFACGLTNPMALPISLFTPAVALQLLLIGTELFGTAVLFTAMVDLAPRSGLIIMLLMQPLAVLIAPLVAAVGAAFPELEFSRLAVEWNITSLACLICVMFFVLAKSKGGKFQGGAVEPQAHDLNDHRFPVVHVCCYSLLAVKVLRSIVTNFVHATWSELQLFEEVPSLNEDQTKERRLSSQGPPEFIASGSLQTGTPSLMSFGREERVDFHEFRHSGEHDHVPQRQTVG
jgi:hypothetical protein